MSAPVLRTRQGLWEGRWQGDANPLGVFRGVRYAAPPTGSLRWSPPRPLRAFDGVRAAHQAGPACPQSPGWDAPYRAAARLAGVDPAVVAMDPGPTGEDCLCLDLWTPSLDPGARLPVMLWVHGGASAFGSGSCPMFDGSRLAAEHDVVVVSINYRLGVLGFLGHEELVRESPTGTAGNYGFLDLVAALEWVRDNAPACGGDRDNVTVFGESAGGRAVFELLAYAPARGLFARAIAQSPWDETHHHRRLDERFEGLEPAIGLGARLARELGLPGEGSLETLRATATPDLLAAADRLGFAGSLWGPIVDGVVFPDHPLAMLARREADAVPLLVGWNADEGTIFFLGDLPFPTAETYRGYVEQAHPSETDRLLEIYPPAAEELDLHRSFSRLYGDRTFVFPGLLAAKALAPRTRVHVYRFGHVHPPFSATALAATRRSIGSFHASEIPLVFGTATGEPLDEADEELGRCLRAYWANFAESGDPNGEGVPGWPRFLPGEELHLAIEDRISERAAPAADTFPVLARALGPRLGLSRTEIPS